MKAYYKSISAQGN